MDDIFLLDINRYFRTRYGQPLQIDILSNIDIANLLLRGNWPDNGLYLYLSKRRLLLTPPISDGIDQLIELMIPNSATPAYAELRRYMLSSQAIYRGLLPFNRVVRISGLRPEDVPQLIFQKGGVLKFVYRKKGSIVSFLVDESKQDSFRHEIEIRKKIEGRVVTPKIIEDSELYYEEELINGRNLSGSLGDATPQVLERGFEQLFNLYRSSEINESCAVDYATDLKSRILEHLYPYRSDTNYQEDAVSSVNELHRALLGKLEQADMSIVHLTETHGDFTPVNILYSEKEDKVYIVDWKESRRASIYSDFFMFWINLKHRFDAHIHLPPSEWEHNSIMVDISRKLQRLTGDVNIIYLDAMLLLTFMEKIHYSFVFEKGFPEKWFKYLENKLIPSFN